MPRTRRPNVTAQQKVAILREVLVERRPASEVCERHPSTEVDRRSAVDLVRRWVMVGWKMCLPVRLYIYGRAMILS